MKVKIVIAVGCAMIALCGGVAGAQDVSRVPDTNSDAGAAVDASVHAGADERAAQPSRPPKQSNERRNTYSRWAFQATNQASATSFHPNQSTNILPAQPARGDNTSTNEPPTRSEISRSDFSLRGTGTSPRTSAAAIKGADPRLAAVRSLLQDLNNDGSTPLPGFKTKTPVISPYSRTNSFSTTAREQTFQPIQNALFPNPLINPDVLGVNSLTAEPMKRTPPKSVTSPGSRSAKQN